MHPFSFRFWTPKTSLLGPNLEPSWPSVSHQDGPRSLPPPKRPPRPNLEPAWFSKSPQDGPGGLPAPPWRLLGSILEGRGSLLKVFGSHFLHTFDICELHFLNNLSLMLKHFFTRIWCWMGCWGYAKSQAFILFDLIRFEFYSLQGARILEPKTTTKF